MDYHAPQSLNEALDLLAGGGLRIIAGGTDVYPAMPQGGPGQSLLDVTRVDGMRGIDRGRDGWVSVEVRARIMTGDTLEQMGMEGAADEMRRRGWGGTPLAASA